MRKVVFSMLLLALVPRVATSQSNLSVNQCPLPLYVGPWTGEQISEAKVVSSTENGLTRLQSAPAKGTKGSLTISQSTCEGSFMLELDPYEVIMRDLGGWVDALAPVYRGTADFHATTQVGLTIFALSPTELVLATSGNTSLTGRGSGTFDSAIRAEYQGELEPRPECLCRQQLEEHIDRSIQEAKRVIAAYRNESFQKLPPQLKEGQWNLNTYEMLMDAIIYGGKSYSEAAETIRQKIAALGQAATNQQSAGDTETSVVTAKTSTGCHTTYGRHHLTSCFPFIDLEATKAHEEDHQAECRESRLSPWGTTIPGFAKSEVRGWKVELEYYEKWISRNCE